MHKRIVILLAALIVMLPVFFCKPALAVPEQTATPKVRLNHKANPLPSAMFLVLGGMGVSLLFDKKK